ncbi:MAG TPA: EamA family transporter [Candidatus Dormibacteraeota bacterium]|nr:EamA family transporter [Candidatus Dormibacteraeota bacterium]
MVVAYLGLVGAILFGIAGQIVLKSGALASPTLAAQFVNPLTLGGVAIYGCAAVCYIVALQRIPVSLAFPSVAASYAVVAIIAHLLWNEPLGWPQVAGLLLILAGILLLHQH